MQIILRDLIKLHIIVVNFRPGPWKTCRGGICSPPASVSSWSERDLYRYFKRHHLPYHPLWEQGYVSVGDVHTSRPLEPGMLAEHTRFLGLKRECGLHE
jgi:hypothetical protein